MNSINQSINAPPQNHCCHHVHEPSAVSATVVAVAFTITLNVVMVLDTHHITTSPHHHITTSAFTSTSTQHSAEPPPAGPITSRTVGFSPSPSSPSSSSPSPS
ncbi:hypothetical protein EX30DRAFT_348697 [Ascodesmis nigricans]|uniref:Uncharacterized protein n=1 Tax=Ascodesmis nigricans TaxID=341454 RepID=A0A4S2MXT0_9PEZI|nr:hypothetical protein EX30DRAFT_348697 [Ascodesmis nigricans]